MLVNVESTIYSEAQSGGSGTFQDTLSNSSPVGKRPVLYEAIHPLLRPCGLDSQTSESDYSQSITEDATSRGPGDISSSMDPRTHKASRTK